MCATVVGYRQWRKQQSFEAGSPFRDQRGAAYRELWEQLETIDVRLREVNVCDAEFSASVRGLNAYLLRAEIYLDTGIRARVKDYLDAAREVSKMMEFAPKELREEHYLTMPGRPMDWPGAPNSLKELYDVMMRARDARDAILSEVRTSLGA
jgi:hypothetical protein